MVKLQWAIAQEEAFDKIKYFLLFEHRAPVYAYFVPLKEFWIKYNSSHSVLGALLLRIDGFLMTSTLSDAETRYAEIEKEILAEVFVHETFNVSRMGIFRITIHFKQ